jgi:hypothetical protein
MIIIIEGCKILSFPQQCYMRRKNGKSVSKWCVCAALAVEWHNAAEPLCFSHHEFDAFGLFRDHYTRDIK